MIDWFNDKCENWNAAANSEIRICDFVAHLVKSRTGVGIPPFHVQPDTVQIWPSFSWRPSRGVWRLSETVRTDLRFKDDNQAPSTDLLMSLSIEPLLFWEFRKWWPFRVLWNLRRVDLNHAWLLITPYPLSKMIILWFPHWIFIWWFFVTTSEALYKLK